MNTLRNLSYFLAVFVNVNPESYWILGLLMIVDTLTGIIRSGVVHGWRTVTSHDASTGILAKGCLILVPLLIALSGRGVGLDLSFVAKSTLNILICSELYSILSNVQSVRLCRDVEEFDAINYLLIKLRLFLEKTVKKTDI